MFMRRRGVAVSIAFSAGLLGACGSGRSSHSAFVAKINAICASAAQQRQQTAQGFDFDAFDPDTSELAPAISAIEKNVAIGRHAVGQVRAVKGPAHDEALAAEWAGNADRFHQLDDQSIAALRRGDRSAFKAIAGQEDDLHAQLDRTRHHQPGDPVFKDC